MKTPKKFFQKFFLLLKKSHKHQVIFGISLFLIIVVIVLTILFKQGYTQRKISENPDGEDKSKQDYNLPQGIRNLDGVPTDPDQAEKRPLAIVIENLITIRPQFGLGQANLVYEVLAEGGITRFLALYSGVEIDKIGPVRSARVYFSDWVQEYDALFAHCGGDPYALRLLRSSDIKDLDQMYNGTFYWRTQEFQAPHNLFTKIEFLEEAMEAKGWEDKGEFEPWLFKEEKAQDLRPETAEDIEINYSTASYRATWKYDRDTNTYLRYNGGVPHIDQNTGEQIKAKNVVVQYMVARLKDPGSKAGRLGMHTLGGDKALVFQDGEVIEGIWKKNYPEDRTRFYTKDWQEIEFNPGKIWIEVIPPEKEVNY